MPLDSDAALASGSAVNLDVASPMAAQQPTRFWGATEDGPTSPTIYSVGRVERAAHADYANPLKLADVVSQDEGEEKVDTI